MLSSAGKMVIKLSYIITILLLYAGKTPLQISLVMDADSAIFLIQNGAKLHESAFLTPDTGSTLHELYKSKTSLGLIKATKFAVEHGFRSHINVRDQDGNTALYVLLRHVGRTVKSCVQSEYDREVSWSLMNRDFCK